MTQRLDPDIKGLKACVRGMDVTTPRMRKATLDFLWDKYALAPLYDYQRFSKRVRKLCCAPSALAVLLGDDEMFSRPRPGQRIPLDSRGLTTTGRTPRWCIGDEILFWHSIPMGPHNLPWPEREEALLGRVLRIEQGHPCYSSARYEPVYFMQTLSDTHWARANAWARESDTAPFFVADKYHRREKS